MWWQKPKSLGDSESGFTLIELLVVILIIGVLAAIAVPMFLNQRREAVDASLKSDIKNLATELETWKITHTHMRYPSAAWRPADTTHPYGTHNNRNLRFTPTEGNYIKTYAQHSSDINTGYCIVAWSPGSTQYRTENTGMVHLQDDGVIGNPDKCPPIEHAEA